MRAPSCALPVCGYGLHAGVSAVVAGMHVLLAEPLTLLFTRVPLSAELGKWPLISQATLCPAFGCTHDGHHVSDHRPVQNWIVPFPNPSGVVLSALYPASDKAAGLSACF